MKPVDLQGVVMGSEEKQELNAREAWELEYQKPH